jgi:hypothetical protein
MQRLVIDPQGLSQHDLGQLDQSGESIALNDTPGEPAAGHADDAE